ncbi:sulfatase family protein [Kribbella endophytica]
MTNILLLHCHDLGRFLGCYGVETVSTPSVDALAGEGVLFEQAFAASPTCSPARASLFTGTYPQRNGVLGLTHDPFSWDLADPSLHLANRLRDNGYRTELIGVHHESRVLSDGLVAARLGFDAVDTDHSRDAVVANTRAALDRAAADGRPFYLQVGFHEPHRTVGPDSSQVMGFLGEGVSADDSRGVTVPAYLHDDAAAREEIAELQGAVRYMDEGVGAVLAHLDAVGLAESTVVIFTTDHGLALPGAKCTLYDSGLGVALIVRVPGRAGWTGRRISSVVQHVDVVPTLLDLVGIEQPEELVGTSLTGGSDSERPAFGQQNHHVYADPKRSVRTATHKLIANFGNAPRAMDPTQSWQRRTRPRFMPQPAVETSQAFELYDLRTDPDELYDLAAGRSGEAAAIFDSLAAQLLDWMRREDDPLLSARPITPRHAAVLATLEAASRHPVSSVTLHPSRGKEIA